MARRLSCAQLCWLAVILIQIRHLAGGEAAPEVSGQNQYASLMRPRQLQLKSGAANTTKASGSPTGEMALQTASAPKMVASLDLEQEPRSGTPTTGTGDAGEHPAGVGETEAPRSPLLGPDEDVVISASEILADSSPFGPRPRASEATQNASCQPEEAGWPQDQLAEHRSAPARDRHQPNSRLLLQILVLGLFGLVSLSLVLVYAIKFCVCRRRKRRLQRNLVADLDQRQFECTCQQPPGLHRPPMPGPWSSGPCGPLQLQPTALRHQLDSLRQQQPSCLLPDHLPRPPTYAELFGSQATVNGEQSGAGESLSPADGPSSCSPAEPNANQPQKNLLVKLNLNKTKLLSAEDLVLLSKLIDVPIVVQQQQHQPPPPPSPQAPMGSDEQVSRGLEPARPASPHEESQEEAQEGS